MLELSALSFAYVMSLFYRAVVSVIAPELSADLDLDESDLGALSSLFFIGFAGAQIPVGMALDRLGPRLTVSLFMGFAIAGAFLFALAQGFWTALAGMGMIGIGCAPIFTGSMVVVARKYPPERFAYITAILLTVGGIGDLLSTAPLALLTELITWRGAIGVAAGFTVLAALLCLRFIEADQKAPDHQPESLSGLFRGMASIGAIKALWPVLPLCFFGYSVLMAVRGLWSGPYLADVFQLDTTERGWVLLAMSITLGFGTFIYGLADKIFRRPKTIVALGSTVIALVLASLALTAPNDWQWAAAHLVVIGLFGVTYPVLMAHGRSFIPAHMTGRGVSFLTLVNILGVAVVQAASGWIIEGALASERTSAQSYELLFAILAGTMGMAVAIYLFSRESLR